MNNDVFYDYIEIQPLSLYKYLVILMTLQMKVIYRIILKNNKIATDNKKIIVATGDVHQLDKEDNIYREIIVNQKVPGEYTSA